MACDSGSKKHSNGLETLFVYAIAITEGEVHIF